MVLISQTYRPQTTTCLTIENEQASRSYDAMFQRLNIYEKFVMDMRMPVESHWKYTIRQIDINWKCNFNPPIWNVYRLKIYIFSILW